MPRYTLLNATRITVIIAGLGIFTIPYEASAQSVSSKPNILVIFGDDIGQTNISAYSFGVVGYKTPNIDRIAKEGMMFTDYYAENSCTAGRSSFITGQTPKRTGLSKVGHSGRARRDCKPRHHHRPGTQAARLRHRPVRQEPSGGPQRVPAHRARVRRILGNLYHLNAEEEPERPYWPKDDTEYASAQFTAGRASRLVHDTDDATVQPHWGKVGKQRIEDTGPLTGKRMETIDDETLGPPSTT